MVEQTFLPANPDTHGSANEFEDDRSYSNCLSNEHLQECGDVAAMRRCAAHSCPAPRDVNIEASAEN